MSELISLALLQIDADHQAREVLNDETVAAYAAVLIEGGELPPVVAFKSDDGVWLGDGFHRRAAYQKAERTVIPADVRKGGKRDAFLFALGANADHGLRRSNADLRRAVTLALQDPELGQLGDRALAKICRVSHPFVGKVRAALNVPESSLDTVDLWEGERDPEAQVRRVLDCGDVAECEALLGAAGCVVQKAVECVAHRNCLRQIARAKLHADVAEALWKVTDGVKAAATLRSHQLALYDKGTDGAQLANCTKPGEWAKALQYRDLSSKDRWIGLVAQVVKPGAYGIEKEHLLNTLPDCTFKEWVREQAAKKKERIQSDRSAAKTTPWPAPVFGSPEQAEQEAEMLAWFTTASPELLREFWEWGHGNWTGYKQHNYQPWITKEVVCAARAAIEATGAEVAVCPDPCCDGFTSPVLYFYTPDKDDGSCWQCHQSHNRNVKKNEEARERVAGLLRRGLVTPAELGIESAPVVEAALVKAALVIEAPEVETLPPAAPVEAAPVEAAPSYRVGWGDDAKPAQRLCGRLQRAAAGDLSAAFEELHEAFTAWDAGRVVPSPLVRWVAAFDVLGRWLSGQGFANEVIEAVRALVPALGAVTPPAVSDTDPPPPIALADQDLWASVPFARAVVKSLTAYQGGCGKENESLLKRALVQAAHWQQQKEPIPEGMPEEVLIVLQLAAQEDSSPQRVVDALASACFAGPVALRWINNAEEDEPVKTTSPTGRAMQAIKDAELGAAAK